MPATLRTRATVPARTLHLAPRLALVGLLALGGCSRRNESARSTPEVTPLRTLRADSVFVLEVGGTPPADTVVRLAPGERRVIVLRHGPPDQAAFAVVDFGDSAFTGGDSVERHHPLATRRLRPRHQQQPRVPRGQRHVQVRAPLRGTPRGARALRQRRTLRAPSSPWAGCPATAASSCFPPGAPRPTTSRAALDGPGAYVVAGPR